MTYAWKRNRGVLQESGRVDFGKSDPALTETTECASMAKATRQNSRLSQLFQSTHLPPECVAVDPERAPVLMPGAAEVVEA